MQNITDVTDEDIMSLCRMNNSKYYLAYRPLDIIVILVKLGNLDLAWSYFSHYCSLNAAEAALSASPDSILPWLGLPKKTKIAVFTLDQAKDHFKNVCKRIVETGERLASSRNIS
jgi:hypothetical protein